MKQAIKDIITILFTLLIFGICLYNIDKTPILAVIMLIDIVEGVILLDI